MSDSHVRAITTAIASGSAEAFGRFYDDWFDYMYAQVKIITQRDEATCLDIVQEAMIRVVRFIKPFDETAPLKAWLRVVVMSCTYDFLRTEARRKKREQTALSHRKATITIPQDTTEQLAWLRKELSDMGQQHVNLVYFRYRMGWTLSAIGNLMGLSPGAVDGRLTRTIKELRKRAQSIFQE